jgi:hypothetical protein
VQQPYRGRWQALAQALGDRQLEHWRAAVVQLGAVVDACAAAFDVAAYSAWSAASRVARATRASRPSTSRPRTHPSSPRERPQRLLRVRAIPRATLRPLTRWVYPHWPMIC